MTAKGLIAVCFIFFGCIQQIEIFNGADSVLVVDGVITDQPGPQKVKLAISTKYNEVPSYTKVEGATVIIQDDLGTEETLTYQGRGEFFTSDDFTGIIGRTYHVKIILGTGEEYESLPELLMKVPEIDTVRYHQEGSGVAYFIDFKDKNETENYYRWRYRGTYEFIAPIARKLAGSDQGLPGRGCFSSGAVPNFNNVWKCWAVDFDFQFLKIENDQLFNGREVKDFHIGTLELSLKYDMAYYMAISQYSMTKEAYQYWKAIEDQIGNNGTIFETSNYQIRGNLYSLTNPKELVLGYFGASAVQTKSAFVQDFAGTFEQMVCVPNNGGCYPEKCVDCRKAASSATNVKPDFWPY